MMTKDPQVACIILNWNGWADTVKCLDALARSTYSSLLVMVVDNGSSNDSVAQIRAAHPEVLLFETGKNLGFAAGNNIGIRYALCRGADYLWLLNNDTEPSPDALAALVGKAQTDPCIGAVASVCFYADAPHLVQAWGGARVNLWIGYGHITTTPRPDHWFHSVYGASMLVSARALSDVGLLDEGFFHYWEESEFSLRLLKRGWKLAVAPGSHVLHKVAGSTGKKHPVLDRYFTASGLRILRLHSPVPRMAMLVFVSIRLCRRAALLRWNACGAVWAGVQDYLRARPVIPRTS